MTTAQSDVASDGLKTTAWEAKSDEVKSYFSVGVWLKYHKKGRKTTLLIQISMTTQMKAIELK